ncbi:MAG: hypothetical protein Q4E31_00845 [Intestinibacter bartlettii]|uniref:hypothetical protein n=1 Tax=Intestinibacter bartlettii TaxID=261299 RepID=UPI0026EAA735|nr:hypothetical protein [Intestinibacter bartlettii]MDO5009346.1 hypothetical protein [Intestinibacter bartlettii]
MGEMIINYSELDGLSSTAKRLSDRYDGRIKELGKMRGKLNNLDVLNTGNLEQADLQLKNRISECEQKRNKIDIFKNKVEYLEQEAKNTDRKVAQRISQDTKYFKFKNNVKTGIGSHVLVYLNKIKDNKLKGYETIIRLITGCTSEQFKEALSASFRNLKYNIKDWYYNKGGKYWVNIVKDFGLTVAGGTLLIAAMVGLGAGLIVLAGGVAAIMWKTYKNFSKYVYDIKALKEFNTTKNQARADKIDEKDNRELTKVLAGNLSEATTGNRELGEEIGDRINFAIDSYFFFDTLSNSTEANISEINNLRGRGTLWGKVINYKSFSKTKLEKLNISTDMLGKFNKGIGIKNVNTIDKITNIGRNISIINTKFHNVYDPLHNTKQYYKDYFSSKESKIFDIKSKINHATLNSQFNTTSSKYYNFGT